MTSPLVLFSFAKQLHPGYVLPALPGAALFLNALIVRDPLFERKAAKNIGYVLWFVSSLVLLLFFAGILGLAPNHLLALSVVPLLTAILSIVVSRSPDRNVATIIGCTALTFSSLLGIFLTTFSETIARSASSEPILDCIADNVSETDRSFGVVGSSNYSVMYYARAWDYELWRHIDAEFVDDFSDLKKLPDHFVVRKSELNNIPENILSQYSLIEFGGRWRWFHKNSAAPLILGKCNLNKSEPEALL